MRSCGTPAHIWRFVLCLVIVSCCIFAPPVAGADRNEPQSLDDQGLEVATKHFLAHWSRSGDSYFSIVGSEGFRRIDELRKPEPFFPNAEVLDSLNEADKLNGVEWRRVVFFRYAAMRSYDLQAKTGWSEWNSPKPHPMGRNGYWWLEVMKKKGEWTAVPWGGHSDPEDRMDDRKPLDPEIIKDVDGYAKGPLNDPTLRAAARMKMVTQRRDAVVRSVENFLAKGNRLQGRYLPDSDNLPFIVTITGEIRVRGYATPGELDESFEVPARFVWLKDTASLISSRALASQREWDGKLTGTVYVTESSDDPPTVEIGFQSMDGDNYSGNDTTWARWDGSSFRGRSLYERMDSPASQASPLPEAKAVAPPPAQPKQQAVAYRFTGKWTGTDQTTFTFDIHLSVNDRTATGQIDWTLASTPALSSLKKRVGGSGTEFVEGTFDATSRRFDLRGTRVTDPSLLGTDQYRFVISADGKKIEGNTRGGGDWKNRITGQKPE